MNTLALKFAEAFALENYLWSIVVIEGYNDPKDSKEYGKKKKASSNRTKYKYYFDMERLVKSLNLLMNEVSESRRRPSEALLETWYENIIKCK